MRKLLLAVATLIMCAFAAPALAANCPSFTYTLTNGQTADANQVMSNFNTLLNCSNNNLAHNGINADITSLTALSVPLTVAEGGTGHGTIASGGLIYGNGASATTVLSPGSNGQALLSNGSVPFWGTPSIPCSSISNAGNACTENIGTTAGTIASGGDSRFVGAAAFNGYSSNHTLVIGDAGAVVFCQTGMTVVTIPPNASVPFTIGTKIEIINWFNGSGALTLSQGSGVQIVWAPSGAVGNRVMNGSTPDAIITYLGSNNWLITGVGLT